MRTIGSTSYLDGSFKLVSNFNTGTFVYYPCFRFPLKQVLATPFALILMLCLDQSQSGTIPLYFYYKKFIHCKKESVICYNPIILLIL